MGGGGMMSRSPSPPVRRVDAGVLLMAAGRTAEDFARSRRLRKQVHRQSHSPAVRYLTWTAVAAPEQHLSDCVPRDHDVHMQRWSEVKRKPPGHGQCSGSAGKKTTRDLIWKRPYRPIDFPNGRISRILLASGEDDWLGQVCTSLVQLWRRRVQRTHLPTRTIRYIYATARATATLHTLSWADMCKIFDTGQAHLSLSCQCCCVQSNVSVARHTATHAAAQACSAYACTPW